MYTKIYIETKTIFVFTFWLQLLERSLKLFIKTACCFPERITKKDYDSILTELKHSEKVSILFATRIGIRAHMRLNERSVLGFSYFPVLCVCLLRYGSWISINHAHLSVCFFLSYFFPLLPTLNRSGRYTTQVHINLMILEARNQAEILYALREIMRYMTWYFWTIHYTHTAHTHMRSRTQY